jgi:hypothetical protein
MGDGSLRSRPRRPPIGARGRVMRSAPLGAILTLAGAESHPANSPATGARDPGRGSLGVGPYYQPQQAG